jgi:hypothetical protein
MTMVRIIIITLFLLTVVITTTHINTSTITIHTYRTHQGNRHYLHLYSEIVHRHHPMLFTFIRVLRTNCQRSPMNRMPTTLSMTFVRMMCYVVAVHHPNFKLVIDFSVKLLNDSNPVISRPEESTNQKLPSI